ncbi:MAG: hypothetical protein LBH12_02765 [Dysgonamonadaceae bacterium]|jgi:predicted O-methyltransferase YrrM|nr:hypothetical protein [Dysgonamonadaceae bacterium]
MKLPGTKLYRKLRYRKGFGVHSPFVYNLITKVIEEKAHYYAFKEIEDFRIELLERGDDIASITRRETQSPAYGAFLFRMVNFFKSENVVQIGCSTGVMSLYLIMAASPQTDFYLLEDRENLLNPMERLLLARNLNGIHVLKGDYRRNIETGCSKIQKCDMIFINHISKNIHPEDFFHLMEPLINDSTVLIIDNIGKNKRKEKFWQYVRKSSKARITIDLYSSGIIFFDDKYPKRNYKTYFSNGKNIHKNRRQWLHFSRRRKKSFKSKPSH